MTLFEMQKFFAWTLFINISFLAVSALLLLLARDKIASVHAKMMGISPDGAKHQYFRFLAGYKLIILAFFLAPYLALRFGL